MTTATSAFHVTSPPTIAAAGGELQKTTAANDTTQDPSPTGVVVSLGSSDQPPPARPDEKPNQLMEDETEDEEVKMNCIGGLRGVQDSDMNTTDDDMSNDGDDDDEERAEEKDPDEYVTMLVFCSLLKISLMDCISHFHIEFCFLHSTQGVVQFVSNRAKGTFPLLRPKATTPPTPTSRLSPQEEGDEERSTTSSSDGDDESSCSSVGARGIPFAIGTPMDDASMEDDDDDENGENDDDDNASTSSSSSSESEDENEAEQSESPVKSESVNEVGEEVVNTNKEDEQVDELSINTDAALEGSNDELSELLTSLGEDPIDPVPDELDTSERFIGVMEDGDDFVEIPKTKRVLSFNTLAALNIEARGKGHSPKRLCKDHNVTEPSEAPSLLGSFTLGPPAMSESPVKFHLLRRESSPVISSSDEEGDEYDRQLEEELAENTAEPEEREETPVPLLTPPGSPLTVEVDGNMTTVCEWPSNLTVDSAMAAASELRPLSPSSLEDLEQKDREWEDLDRKDQELEEAARPQASSSTAVCPSTLTPMLRGISVGRD